MKINISEKCNKAFQDLKFKHIEARYLVFAIQKEQIVLERIGAKEESWADFITSLPPKEYRYCVFDLQFVNEDNMHINKMFLCNWSPDESPIKGKMLYATGKETFRSTLDLFGKEVTLNSADDMTYEDLLKEFK